MLIHLIPAASLPADVAALGQSYAGNLSARMVRISAGLPQEEALSVEAKTLRAALEARGYYVEIAADGIRIRRAA